MPPVSGHFNNWFKHCMGSPIRSEIWACIAPGMPHVAAAYAYEDAIVDHAGGESVYGEMFNAGVEAAAFVLSDRDQLLDVGLSLIPENCETAKAIRAAREAHAQGAGWKEARNRVLRTCYSPIAQYSPINLGFQTVGWLYGEDFGDAICKAVNCGYDTDCTGATLGSILGIINGKDGLPTKWTSPLGDKISTNASWGGIANLREPKDLDELTSRTCAIGRKVLALQGGRIEIGVATNLSEVHKLNLKSPEGVKRFWNTSPRRVGFDLRTLSASIEYPDGPAAAPGKKVPFRVVVINPRPVELEIEVSTAMPPGWIASPSSRKTKVSPMGETTLNFTAKAEDAKSINTSIRGSVRLATKGRPQVEDMPLTLAGSNSWLLSRAFRFKGEPSLDEVFAPEKNPAPKSLGEGWKVAYFPENELPIEKAFGGRPGALYLRHYAWSPDGRPARVGVPSNCLTSIWLNGAKIHECRTAGVLRPNYSGDGRSYADVNLSRGWNQFLIKIVRGDQPIEAHFILCGPGRLYPGFYDLVESLLPWKEPAKRRTQKAPKRRRK
jgi:hypothetical protein